ncbi:MAG: hypothetical protein ACI4PL_03015 [Faecousia sp.]
MKRRILAVFAAAGLVLALRTVASAVGMGSLTLQLARDGTPVPDAAVAVYRVGTAAVGGYRLTEDFGGGFISEADVLYPELIGWLAGETGGQALRRNTDSQGQAYFGSLEEGLYLVVQEGQAGETWAFEPFILILPWDGTVWDITAAPKMEYREEFTPQTSDPGSLERGLGGMLLSGLALAALGALRKRNFR